MRSAPSGVLCFVEADWPVIGGSLATPSMQALWPMKLYPRLQGYGRITADVVAEIHRNTLTATGRIIRARNAVE